MIDGTTKRVFLSSLVLYHLDTYSSFDSHCVIGYGALEEEKTVGESILNPSWTWGLPPRLTGRTNQRGLQLNKCTTTGGVL